MKALILREDAHASVETARALIDKGFQILSVDTLAVAHALIRIETVDLLVLDERVEGQLTHAIALSGERRNPYLSAIFLTDRTGEETDDLYDLIPSLYALAGATTAPDLLGQLALSAVSNVEEAAARVARNAAIDEAEGPVAPEVEPLILSRADLTPAEDDAGFDVPSYADVAIAAPAMTEIAAEEVAAPVMAEFAATETAAPAMTEFAVAEDAMPEMPEFAVAEGAMPEMTEVTATEDAMPEEVPQDAVSAEVAALFRKPALPHFLQAQRVVAAKAG